MNGVVSVSRDPESKVIEAGHVLTEAIPARRASKNIFIYDPCASGHHAGFLRVLLLAFAEKEDWRTTLLTVEEARRHPAFERLAAEFKSGLDIVVAHHRKEPAFVRRLLGHFYAEQYVNCKVLRREFRALNAERSFDFALIPYLETLGVYSLAFWSFFGQVPWAVIPHGLRCHFAESGIKSPPRRVDALQGMCLRRMLQASSLRRVFALDPYLVSWANHPRVVYVPDPSSLPLPWTGRFAAALWAYRTSRSSFSCTARSTTANASIC